QSFKAQVLRPSLKSGSGNLVNSSTKLTHFTMSANPSFSSNELEIVEGSILGNHYKVEAFLGEGGFGIVAKCRDTKTNRALAIKVNKSRPDILQQAKLEIFILEQLRRLEPDRVCLNFKLLDQCLWDYIGDRNNQGLPISKVGPILGQLTNALSHLGSVGIVHADLKPGNIVVVNRHESPVKVRLTDFGLACPASAVNPSDCVGTVGYSAPEVMLGLPYNEARSLGLVAVELATGVPLYPVENECDYLKFIIETQGQPPDHVLDSGVYTDDYFIEDNYKQQRAMHFKVKTLQQSDAPYEQALGDCGKEKLPFNRNNFPDTEHLSPPTPPTVDLRYSKLSMFTTSAPCYTPLCLSHIHIHICDLDSTDLHSSILHCILAPLWALFHLFPILTTKHNVICYHNPIYLNSNLLKLKMIYCNRDRTS
uniref:Protein kinase domain-containing protein n=1 Tax=Neolamprologus brichardi TaxID=32507 RepID=A0A3Q4I2Z5_NEOBR